MTKIYVFVYMEEVQQLTYTHTRTYIDVCIVV